MSSWNDSDLIKIFSDNTLLIDVRAPVEFAAGSIPNSVNLPLMNDEERRLVGICYKEHGQSAAIQLGHSLVNGPVKEERIRLWRDYLHTNPSAEVFCFRGGLRSQISCEWIDKNKSPLPGGYKRLRQFFLSWLDESPLHGFIRIGGLTGSGKTNLLHKLKYTMDLEGHANHRGSAFGPRGPQPSQITFENLLALDLLKLHGRKIIMEDESATLGKVVIPNRVFHEMRASSLIILDIEHEERLFNIFNDYVKDSTSDFFITNLQRIQKKFGIHRSTALAQEIKLAFEKGSELRFHETWITTLLREYYDPLYLKDLRYNQDKVIFKGKEQDVLAFLASL